MALSLDETEADPNLLPPSRPASALSRASAFSNESDDEDEFEVDRRYFVQKRVKNSVLSRDGRKCVLCHSSRSESLDLKVVRFIQLPTDSEQSWLRSLGLLPDTWQYSYGGEEPLDNLFTLCVPHYNSFLSRAWTFVPAASEMARIQAHAEQRYAAAADGRRHQRHTVDPTTPTLSSQFELVVIRPLEMRHPYPKMIRSADGQPRIWDIPFNPYVVWAHSLTVCGKLDPAVDERCQRIEEQVYRLRRLYNRSI